MSEKKMLLIESDEIEKINKRLEGLESLLKIAQESHSFNIEVPIERKQFARIINMPVATLDRQRKQGVLKSYKFGGKVYVFMSDFIKTLVGEDDFKKYLPKSLSDFQRFDE